MAFTTSPVPMDLASLRLRALQRDMSAAATDAAATVFTAAPVMEALSRHLKAAHSKEQPASSAAAKSGAALLNDQVRDSLERRLRTEDEERQHLAQRILAAQRTCTAAVSFQQGASEMPRVGLAGGATAGALVERARALVAAQVPSACPAFRTSTAPAATLPPTHAHSPRHRSTALRIVLRSRPTRPHGTRWRTLSHRRTRSCGGVRCKGRGSLVAKISGWQFASLRLSPLFTGGTGQRTTNLPSGGGSLRRGLPTLAYLGLSPRWG